MSQKELLIRRLNDWGVIEIAEPLADYLLANGVVVKTKPQTKGKCGSCVYAEPVVAFGQSSCYVKCTNKEHITKYCKGEISALRQRTHLACKKYKERETNDRKR